MLHIGSSVLPRRRDSRRSVMPGFREKHSVNPELQSQGFSCRILQREGGGGHTKNVASNVRPFGCQLQSLQLSLGSFSAVRPEAHRAMTFELTTKFIATSFSHNTSGQSSKAQRVGRVAPAICFRLLRFVKKINSTKRGASFRHLKQDPLDLSFWSFLTFLHRGIEDDARHLL